MLSVNVFYLLVVVNLKQVCHCDLSDNELGSGWTNDTIQLNNCSTGHSNSNDTVTVKDPLYFLVLAPYPDSGSFKPSWAGGPAVVPAAMVARDIINKRDDILRDYTIHFLVSDSGCNVVSKAVSNVTSGFFYSGKNIVGIIGPACSEATLTIAPLMIDSRLSLLQIAVATSPALTNVSRYPNTFRPSVSSLGVVDTYVELIRQKNYRHVGVLYEEERRFQTTVYSRFETVLGEMGIQLTSFGLTNVNFPIEEFRKKIRIIFVFGSDNFVQNLLCFIFNQKLTYPDYQFFFSDRKPANFYINVSFTLEGMPYSCSADEMKQVVLGMVFSEFRLTRLDRDTVTDIGISYSRYFKEYNKVLNLHLESIGLTKAINTEYHSNYFDATWALARSLNNSLPRLKERCLSLSNYMYGMPEITEIVREELLKLRFEGMRGRVEFSEKTHDGVNVTIIDINQILNISQADNLGGVGYYDPLAAEPLFFYPNESLLERADFDIEYITPPLSLGVVVIIAVSVLFVVLFACQVAYVAWGQHKTVKATSPNLNHLIFSGCYLSLVGAVTYTSAFVFIRISDINSSLVIPLHCSVLQWSSTMTYSLIFGTLCAKRWRIYRIFNDFTATQMKHLGDKILLLITLLPLAIDVVVNVLWNVIDPWYFSSKPGPGLLAVAICETDHDVVWAICIAIPKGVLTVIVLYFTVATRRIHKKEFRRTKSINILIYSLLIITGIFLPLFFILQLTVSLWAVSISYVSLCLFNLAFVVLCIVLVLLPPLNSPIKEKLLRRCPIKSN